MRTTFVATSLLGAFLVCMGAGQPTTKPTAEVTLYVTSSFKPIANVPVQVRGVDVQVLGKDRSVVGASRDRRALSGLSAPVYKGLTNEKGLFEIPKIKAGSYMYEAGHPEKMGYAEGSFELLDKMKPYRVEVRLAPPSN